MADTTLEFLEITGKAGDPSAPLTLHKRAGSSKPIKVIADDGGVTTFDPSDVVMADGWTQAGSPAAVNTHGGHISGLPAAAAGGDAVRKTEFDALALLEQNDVAAVGARVTVLEGHVAAFVDPATATAGQIATALIAAGLMAAS